MVTQGDPSLHFYFSKTRMKTLEGLTSYHQPIPAREGLAQWCDDELDLLHMLRSILHWITIGLFLEFLTNTKFRRCKKSGIWRLVQLLVLHQVENVTLSCVTSVGWRTAVA
ncbi:hypothetical protein AVEN_142406-1 [Araneus ventricosus]|uniref:Uncharacterized protein n=1 Tax=Araneus ventricosus TaxID=182803 RepID=A0A4Y2JW90_ARAVE|nr:hypothetical protein AVEN_142406-1 [Araneus ventricosus]